MNVIEDLIQHIQSVNNALTLEYLNSLPVISLIRLTHPLYRSDYAQKAVAQWKLRKEASLEFIKTK